MSPITERDRAKRFDRIIPSVPRIRNSSGVVVSNRTTEKEFERRDGIITKLHENGQFSVLRAFQAGTVSIEQLVEADREGKLKKAELLSDLKLREMLWPLDDEGKFSPAGAIGAALPRMGKSLSTRRRYATSLTKLRRSQVLGDDARVDELQFVDWRGLREDWWEGSPADWNHLGRAVSAFLTVHFGGGSKGKYHPARLEVLDAFEREDEGEGRVPSVTPAQFWELVGRTPEHAQPCYVALAVTGFRAGDYLSCSAGHHNPETCTVTNPKGKTGSRTIVYDPRFREWMRRAFPSPLQYKWMREYFVRARDEMGLNTLWMRDLRHCFGQWSMDGGADERHVQDQLGHKDPKMTRRYTRQQNRGQAAKGLAKTLLKKPRKQAKPAAKPRASRAK